MGREKEEREKIKNFYKLIKAGRNLLLLIILKNLINFFSNIS